MTTLALHPLSSLAPFPGVLARLEALAHQAPDDQETFRNWVGTRLMALWRDERTRESFEALYSFSQASVRSWIQGLLGRNHLALDPRELLQDTFVNVFRYPASFRDDHPGSFRVWVRTIAGNLIRRAHRPAALVTGEYPTGWQEPADVREGPAEVVVEEDEQRRVVLAWRLFLLHYERAWQELAPRDRRALHLVEVEGLAYREAGALLGVGRSNMKMIVFRARQRLARRMRESMALDVARAAA